MCDHKEDESLTIYCTGAYVTSEKIDILSDTGTVVATPDYTKVRIFNLMNNSFSAIIKYAVKYKGLDWVIKVAAGGKFYE